MPGLISAQFIIGISNKKRFPLGGISGQINKNEPATLAFEFEGLYFQELVRSGDFFSIFHQDKTCLYILNSDPTIIFNMPPAAKKKANLVPSPDLTANVFVEVLESFVDGKGKDHSVFLRDMDSGNKVIGVRMADIFKLAKEFQLTPVTEISKLLDSEYYDARIGAVSIMDFKARDKNTSPAEKKQLYELYLRKHRRINNWDMVDRSAPYVVGGYLFDKSREPLYKLAKSKNICERRTAIVATYFFIRQDDIDDTFKIGELLVHDPHESINKAVGSWIREAGKRDTSRLLRFLDKYAGTMPRVTLRYAIEKLNSQQKQFYMSKAS